MRGPRVRIYQAQAVWLCLWEEQIRETTKDVTLQTSLGFGEVLEFEETVVAGIFSSKQTCNRDTQATTHIPTDLESSGI